MSAKAAILIHSPDSSAVAALPKLVGCKGFIADGDRLPDWLERCRLTPETRFAFLCRNHFALASATIAALTASRGPAVSSRCSITKNRLRLFSTRSVRIESLRFYLPHCGEVGEPSQARRTGWGAMFKGARAFKIAPHPDVLPRIKSGVARLPSPQWGRENQARSQFV